MPAIPLFAGMARSYGCPARSFSDTLQNYKTGFPPARE